MCSLYKRKSDGKRFYLYNINNFGNFNGMCYDNVICYLLKSVYDDESVEVINEGLQELFDII